MNISDYKNIVVLGAGESGTGAAILAKAKGYEVFVSDMGVIGGDYVKALNEHHIEFEFGKHDEDRVLAADLIIKSPGIPEKAPLIKALRKKGTPIISEIEFAYHFTKATLVAITGANGKTTTTMLAYHILKGEGLNVGLAGNVGKSFAWQVAEENFDFYVLEISSFQLDDCIDFKPNIAILTNITPDHLDRYDYKMENYVASKFRITMNQDENDHFIYCFDDPETVNALQLKTTKAQLWPFSLEREVPQGAFLNETNTYTLRINSDDTMNIDELALQGKHNAHNSMAAGMAARLLRIRKETIRECLSDFESLEHRLEPVMEIHGIEFINDSKATNVNSTFYALESMKKPIVWIVGGVDKGNDYSQLKTLVEQKVKAIVCLGTDVAKIHHEFQDSIPTIVDTLSMHDAVKAAYQLSGKGDAVLLSPCCASFDLFDNYEDRGRQFKNEVRKL